MAAAPALAPARRFSARRGPDCRRARGRNLLRVAVRQISLGIRETARSWYRARADGPGRSLRSRARLSLGMARHVRLSGTGLLRKARLPGVRAARLPARPSQAFHAQAIGLAGIVVVGRWAGVPKSPR